MSHPRHEIHARAAELVGDQLHSANLDDVTVEQLVDAIQHLESSRATAQTIAGRLIAEAFSRGLTVRDLADRTTIPRSTLDRWAAPFKDQA